MESISRVKRGLKAKLMMTFYRAPKTTQNYYNNNKVKKTATSPVNFPTPPLPPPPPQPKTTKKTDVLSYGIEDFTGEDNVDRMATCYILRVQEGFRREQVDYADWR